MSDGISCAKSFFAIGAFVTLSLCAIGQAAACTSITTLTANRTYFVSTTGNDSNDGLTLATAFLTPQRGVNEVLNCLNLNGFNVAVQMESGTYNGSVVVDKPTIGRGNFVIQGDIPAGFSLLTNALGTSTLTVTNGASVVIRRFRIQNTNASWSALRVSRGGSVIISEQFQFEAGGSEHIHASYGGVVQLVADYSIGGGSGRHYRAHHSGANIIATLPITVSLLGTPNFSVAFADFFLNSSGNFAQAAFAGTATGQRYKAQMNASIYTSNQGPAFFPGSAAGLVASGGVYQ